MQVYRPSNKGSNKAIVQAILASLAGGILIGGIAAAIHRYTPFYLVCVAPLLMGAAIAGIIGVIVRREKLRDPFIAILVAIVGGTAVYGSYQFLDYILFGRPEIQDIATKQLGGAPLTPADSQALNKFMEKYSGFSGFLNYMDLKAKAGIKINSTYLPANSGSSSTPITGPLAYLYWAGEFTAAVGFAAITSRRAAAAPFSEECNQWFPPGKLVAVVEPTNLKDFVNALKQDSFTAARQFFAQTPKLPRGEIFASQVTACPGSKILIKVMRTTRASRKSVNRKLVIQGLVSEQQFVELMRPAK